MPALNFSSGMMMFEDMDTEVWIFKSSTDISARKSSGLGVLWKEYKTVFINSLITTFYLDGILFADQNGGNVQTLHNAENNVFANQEYKDRAERGYNRDDYATSNDMHKMRKKAFNENETIIDGYTGNELPKTGETHLEHIVSAKENHDQLQMRVFMSKDEMKEVINSEDNTLYTNSSLNQSKGDLPLTEWLDKKNPNNPEQRNSERFQVKEEQALKKDKAARKHIDEKVTQSKIEDYINNMSKDSLKQGGKMAVRQCLGLLMTEVFLSIGEFVEGIKSTAFSVEEFFIKLIECLKNAVLRLADKWKSVFATTITGFISGALSSLFTSVINMFLTTAKNIVTLIRQIIVSITEALKILLFNPDSLSKGECLVEALKILIIGINGVVGILISQGISELINKCGLDKATLVGEVIFETLPSLVGGLASGLLTVTVLYFIDHSKEIQSFITFINKMNTNIYDESLKYYEEVNLKITEYAAKIAGIDIDAYESKIDCYSKIGSFFEDREINDMTKVYELFAEIGISLQFGSVKELDAFMDDESSILVF